MATRPDFYPRFAGDQLAEALLDTPVVAVTWSAWTSPL